MVFFGGPLQECFQPIPDIPALGAPDVQFVWDQEDCQDEAQDRDQRLAKLGTGSLGVNFPVGLFKMAKDQWAIWDDTG